ncbi:MAG: ribosomal-protein-alanine N-acetyltransferase [Anaerolineae bacterium UTCFX2]|jgi:ribosomal-protein-alanine N-acetyltransferase|nr:ribosomal protein S18-alanine N-acetyltransferase [Anaerolineae bacterium]MCZ7552352.1 ribosomal protein S18-alanine N-acetyltransferase [Anaerolineales bacterium]OQY91851.1 MAG: ribosomal-protein-alanine N-acetyltransferase [Anaerolineae bacterium UTCFX2]
MNAVVSAAALKIQIRAMQPDDLPRVLEIDQQSFSMPWPASAYQYELNENPDSLLWVAETGAAETVRTVIGMIVVWFIIDEAHIATIAVDPEYRQRGVANELLRWALKAIIQKGFHIATLEVRVHNIAAQNLYRTFGFEVVGSRPRYYRDNNEDALIMTVERLDRIDLDEPKEISMVNNRNNRKERHDP